MIRQKTKCDMKKMIQVMGLAVAAAWMVNTAMAEPMSTSIQVNDGNVSTDVGTVLYQGNDDSVAAPTAFGTWDGGWGQTGATFAPAHAGGSVLPVTARASYSGNTLTADQRAQC